MKKSKELKTAIDAALAAGELLMSKYGKVEPKFKQDRSYVTEADVEAEQIIKSILTDEFSDYSFLGEESGLDDKNSDCMWVVDPLDGTTNYTIQNPFFGVGIGLVKGDAPEVGVFYFPPADELFYAQTGKGAYLNNTPITVSKKEKLEDSVVTFCNLRNQDAIREMAEVFLKVKLITNKFRQFGAGGLELSFVASGRTEAFMMPNANSWDIVAGAVIIKEAGGQVTDFKGNPYNLNSKDVLATNGRVHGRLLDIVKKN